MVQKEISGPFFFFGPFFKALYTLSKENRTVSCGWGPTLTTHGRGTAWMPVRVTTCTFHALLQQIGDLSSGHSE
jgi:hypothetical protein